MQTLNVTLQPHNWEVCLASNLRDRDNLSKQNKSFARYLEVTLYDSAWNNSFKNWYKMANKNLTNIDPLRNRPKNWIPPEIFFLDFSDLLLIL